VGPPTSVQKHAKDRPASIGLPLRVMADPGKGCDTTVTRDPGALGRVSIGISPTFPKRLRREISTSFCLINLGRPFKGRKTSLGTRIYAGGELAGPGGAFHAAHCHSASEILKTWMPEPASQVERKYRTKTSRPLPRRPPARRNTTIYAPRWFSERLPAFVQTSSRPSTPESAEGPPRVWATEKKTWASFPERARSIAANLRHWARFIKTVSLPGQMHSNPQTKRSGHTAGGGPGPVCEIAHG